MIIGFCRMKIHALVPWTRNISYLKWVYYENDFLYKLTKKVNLANPQSIIEILKSLMQVDFCLEYFVLNNFLFCKKNNQMGTNQIIKKLRPNINFDFFPWKKL